MTVTLQQAAGDRLASGTSATEVTWVDPYVTSQKNLGSRLEDEDLASYFLADGPVIAVECELNGEENRFLPGTLLECSIVVEEKAPLSFLFPSLFNAQRGAA